MKHEEIRRGEVYMARVSGNTVPVRVTRVYPAPTGRGHRYDVLNLSTNRRTTFRSAVKFRGRATAEAMARVTVPDVRRDADGFEYADPTAGQTAAVTAELASEAEQRPDPRTTESSGTAAAILSPSVTSAPTTSLPSASTKPGATVSNGAGKQSADPTRATTAILSMPRLSPTRTPAPAPRSNPGPTAPTSQPAAAAATTAGPPAGPGTSPRSGLAARLSGDGRPADDSPHVVVVARAGTGKTTTLVCALQVLKGLRPFVVNRDTGARRDIEPSPQQAAVFEAIGRSRDAARSVGFVAFNRSIADELRNRVPAGCDAMTMHSMGYKAVMKALGRCEPVTWRNQDILAELMAYDSRELKRKRPALVAAVDGLVSLCKLNLIDGSDEPWPEALDRLARHYDVEVDEDDLAEVYQLVPDVLRESKNVRGKIDFDDMIWLVVSMNLPVFRYDLLLVDEAQDLNRATQALAKKAGNRLVLCGDPRQAIYGFAGADADSMPRMIRELTATERGCVELPLTVTRRCGRAIVAEANKIVKDFDAHETNCDGTVRRAAYEDKYATAERPAYNTFAADGDMVLCRVNAPLLSQCFRFLKAGRKATIQGRNIGDGLVSTINKLSDGGTASVAELVGRISDWSDKEQDKESRKKYPSEARLIAIQDRADCLTALTEGADSVADVVAKVSSIFVDKQCPKCKQTYDSKASKCRRPACREAELVLPEGVRLSSIHRAKGLEARRVFLLEPEGATVPHPMAKSSWQLGQEWNLRYVAVTRAIEELVYVN